MSKQLSEAHQRLKEIDLRGGDIPQCRKYYRHFKGGLYWCIGTGVHEATMTPMVAYRDCSIKFPDEALWFRDLEVFQANVEVDGQCVPRFAVAGPIREEEAAVLATDLMDKIESGWAIKDALKTLDHLIPDDKERIWRMVMEMS